MNGELITVGLTHLVGAAMRGHPAFYSGGTALQNVIPQGFLNTEMTCATQSNIKQRSDILTGQRFYSMEPFALRLIQ